MDPFKVEFDSIPWKTEETGMRFKVHKQGKKQLRLVELTEEYFDPHWCTKGHLGFVLEGQLDFNFNGKLTTFKKGDGVFITPGEKNRHMVKVHSGTARLAFVEEV